MRQKVKQLLWQPNKQNITNVCSKATYIPTIYHLIKSVTHKNGRLNNLFSKESCIFYSLLYKT